MLATAGAAAALTLHRQPTGRAATVQRVVAPAHAPDWALRLAELGFIPGERVMITARGFPGGDPLAVQRGRLHLRAAPRRGGLRAPGAGAASGRMSAQGRSQALIPKRASAEVA